MRRVLIIGGLALMAAACLVAVRTRGPKYDGKPAHRWLRELTGSNYEARSRAARAIRALDTNITPVLIERLEATDSSFRSNATKILRFQNVIRAPESPALQARREGLRGFEALGNSALPHLIKLLEDPRRANDAVWLLCQLDDSAIPALLTAITNANVEARRGAALNLGYRHTNAPGVTTALIDRLKTDSDPMTRSIAATSLGKIPGLSDDAVRALVQALDDTDLTTASNAARSLGTLGSRAKEAVPSLVKLYQKPGGHETGAGIALASIDPATAAQHGIAPPRPNPYE